MFRAILSIFSAICLIVLVFTDLDVGQRLLLSGAFVALLVEQWSDFIERRRK